MRRGLIAYNTARVGKPHYRPLVLSARGARGRILGGLVGQLYWNVLYVELFWIAEGARQAGIGRRLMQEAERLARRERKDLIYLNTYSFQAPRFYAKLGYRSFGRIPGYPRGESRIFFVKRLRRRNA